MLDCRLIVLSTAVLACVGAGPLHAADSEKKDELPKRAAAVFERDGVRVVLAMSKPSILVGQPLGLEMVVENVSKSDRTIMSSSLDQDFWSIRLKDANGQSWVMVPPARAASAPAVPIVLKAGEKRILRGSASEYIRFQLKNVPGGGGLVSTLPVGKYALRVSHTFAKDIPAVQLAPVWAAEVVLDGVDVTIEAIK